MTSRYRTRNIAVDAIQFDGVNHADIRGFAAESWIEASVHHAWVRNARGPYPMHAGDWLVREPGKPLRVTSSDAFEATFEETT